MVVVDRATVDRLGQRPCPLRLPVWVTTSITTTTTLKDIHTIRIDPADLPLRRELVTTTPRRIHITTRTTALLRMDILPIILAAGDIVAARLLLLMQSTHADARPSTRSTLRPPPHLRVVVHPTIPIITSPPLLPVRTIIVLVALPPER